MSELRWTSIPTAGSLSNVCINTLKQKDFDEIGALIGVDSRKRPYSPPPTPHPLIEPYNHM